MLRPPRPLLMALLADVKQNPDDLTPWLVLCDWLEEQDDEADRARGEYCRLCFDKLGTKTYASDWEKGERRRELYRAYHPAWLGPITSLSRVLVRKGLLAVNCYDIADYLIQLEIDPETWFWVGSLDIGFLTQKLMSSRSGLGRMVEGLHTLRAAIGVGEISAFASWESLRRIRVLHVRTPTLKVRQARRLIESPVLTGLSNLELHWLDYDLSRAKESDEVERLLVGRFRNRLTIRKENYRG